MSEAEKPRTIMDTHTFIRDGHLGVHDAMLQRAVWEPLLIVQAETMIKSSQKYQIRSSQLYHLNYTNVVSHSLSMLHETAEWEHVLWYADTA